MWRASQRIVDKVVGVGAHIRKINVNGYLKVSDEVAGALSKKEPVVALESTIITHGMPYPDNIRTAQKVESAVRSTGCVPATIGIINGRVHVGMSESEIEYLAKSDHVVKTSRRDFPAVLSQGLNGGTTVSGTMIAAHQAGIPVFVTGGIGGVHRGAENSMDISADLTELGRTPMAVVCAGVKSILDIGRTLEYLETQGVPVVKYGADRGMPAFFSPTSPFRTPYNVSTPEEAAKFMNALQNFGLQSGMVFAVPIPDDMAATGAAIETAIEQSVKEAHDKGIEGKGVTPYILERVNQLTAGKSLQANIALIMNNAIVGGLIARALSRLPHSPDHSGGKLVNGNDSPGERERRVENFVEKEEIHDGPSNRRPVVIGGSIVDFDVKLGTEKYELNGATYPGHVTQLFGGVGRNLADCMSRLDLSPLFISAVGADRQGSTLLDFCRDHMDVSGIRRLHDASTATYVATIEDNGQVVLGVGDMDIHGRVTPELAGEFESDIRDASIVCMDGNIPTSTIQYVAKICQEEQIPVLYEPTDLHKAKKILESPFITYASPNIGELMAMFHCMTGENSTKDHLALPKLSSDELVDYVADVCSVLVERIPNLIVTLGAEGLLVCRRAEDHNQPFPTRGNLNHEERKNVSVHYPNVLDIPPISSVSGAGDCLIGAMIKSILTRQAPDLACKAGLKCAHHSLASFYTVPTDMTSQQYEPDVVRNWAKFEGQLIDAKNVLSAQPA